MDSMLQSSYKHVHKHAQGVGSIPAMSCACFRTHMVSADMKYQTDDTSSGSITMLGLRTITNVHVSTTRKFRAGRARTVLCNCNHRVPDAEIERQ